MIVFSFKKKRKCNKEKKREMGVSIWERRIHVVRRANELLCS